MNLYRVHYTWRNGGASSGEVEYFDTERALISALLDHELDISSHHDRTNWLKFVTALHWVQRRGREDHPRRTTKILSVERVKNDEWVPVTYEFVEPKVLIDNEDWYAQ